MAAETARRCAFLPAMLLIAAEANAAPGPGGEVSREAPGETIVVHPRLRPAPVPDRSIRDPDEIREERRSHDPLTGAAIAPFGDAYRESAPLPVLNPALRDADPPLEGGPPP